MGKRYRNAEWLREQYHRRGHRIAEIADKCNCATSTIRRWMRNHGIETRSRSDYGYETEGGKHTGEGWLREQYQENRLSLSEVADKTDVGQPTIRRWMDKFDIPTRTRSEANSPEAAKYQDEKWLREKYVEERLTTYEIAELCDCTAAVVQKWLRKHGIEARKGVEAQLRREPRYTDEDWLAERYISEGRSAKDIADECGVATTTILSWVRRHGFQVRDAFQQTGEVSVRTGLDGYEWVQHAGHSVPVHRLVPIAEHGFGAVSRMVVHHANELKWDNRPENLDVVTQSEHRRIHNEAREGQ